MRYLLLFTIALGASAQTSTPPTYDDDIRPIFQRRCFACHSAAEARAGLNLEMYAGVMRGGGSGDVVKLGLPSRSMLYRAVAHEGNGVPQMPLNQPKISDAEISLIEVWIQKGLLESASSRSKAPATQGAEFKGSDL